MLSFSRFLYLKSTYTSLTLLVLPYAPDPTSGANICGVPLIASHVGWCRGIFGAFGLDSGASPSDPYLEVAELPGP